MKAINKSLFISYVVLAWSRGTIFAMCSLIHCLNVAKSSPFYLPCPCPLPVFFPKLVLHCVLLLPCSAVPGPAAATARGNSNLFLVG